MGKYGFLKGITEDIIQRKRIHYRLKHFLTTFLKERSGFRNACEKRFIIHSLSINVVLSIARLI